MQETGKTIEIRDGLIDTNRFCILSKGQSVTIPKAVRSLLSLNAGDEVTVGLKANSNEIVIQKLIGRSVDNIMVITNKGSIRIPEELKRTLCLKKGATFQIYLSADRHRVLLKIK